MKPMPKFPNKTEAEWHAIDQQDKKKEREAAEEKARLDKAPKKDYDFTMQQLVNQIERAAATIMLREDQPLLRYHLEKYYNKILKYVSKRARLFCKGTKPILPTDNSVFCMAINGERGPVKMCIQTSDLYCRGVYVREVFYEYRKTRDPTCWVQGSVPLEHGESYQSLLGAVNPALLLSSSMFKEAYHDLSKLGTENGNLDRAAHAIGVFAVLFMEPSRQSYFCNKFCGERTSRKDDVYHTLTEQCWKEIRRWNERSNAVKGMKHLKEKGWVEQMYDPKEKAEAEEEILIANSHSNQ